MNDGGLSPDLEEPLDADDRHDLRDLLRDDVPLDQVVRPAISLLHRDPPLTAKSFFYHRRSVFATTLGTAVLLAVLASYSGGEVLLRVDEPVTEWIVDHRTGGWTDFFNLVSRFGDNLVVFSAALGLAAWTWPRCRYLAVTLVLAALFRPAVEFVLKFVVDRSRPDLDPLGTFDGPSHPSGHPLAAASLWGQFPAVVALHLRSRVLWWVAVVVAFGIGGLVAMARVYKGAHHLTDVVASFAWAALYLAAVQGFFDRFHGTTNCRHPQHRVQADLG